MPNEIASRPLDLTGVNPDNLIVDENHTFSSLADRVFALSEGSFFSRGLVVKDGSTNTVLEPVTQYQILYLHTEATERTTQTVCQVLYVADPDIDNVKVTYQAVGGEYSVFNETLDELLSNIDPGSTGYIPFNTILNRPEQYQPVFHYHNAEDFTDWDKVLYAIKDIREAILLGDKPAFSALYEYLRFYVGSKVNDLTTETQENFYTKQEIDSALDYISETFSTRVDYRVLKYTHNQTTPSTTWVVQHDLNRFVIPIVTDELGYRIDASETRNNSNKLTLTFSQAIIGSVTVISIDSDYGLDSFTYNQAELSTSWIIPHNLDSDVTYQAYLNDGSKISASSTVIDSNTLELNFSRRVRGRVKISTPTNEKDVSTYVHEQVEPSSTWVINHVLGTSLKVLLRDTNGNELIGNIFENSSNQLTVIFNLPFAGKAYLSA